VAGLAPADEGRFAQLREALSFRRVSAAYILVAMLIVFAFWIPDLFYRWTTIRSVLFEDSVTAILGIGLVVPFAAGAFDASVGANMGLASVLVGELTVVMGLPAIPALIITLLAGAAVGAVNGLVVVGLGVDSIIATLAMMSVLTGLGAAPNNGQIITGLPPLINNLGAAQLAGLALPVWLMLVLALVIWYVLEKTIVGRHIYATGGNAKAARLAGVRTKRIIVVSLVVSGLISAFGGIVASGRVDAGQAAIGPPYLLPAFAAAFLGATQIKVGRFNIWGTVLATYTLATGLAGLSLAGAPSWLPDVFDGVALALAVGLSIRRNRPRAGSADGDEENRVARLRRMILSPRGNREAAEPAD
jgi:ribose transport system permease protein